MPACGKCGHINRAGANRCARCGKLLPGAVLQSRYEITSVLPGGGQGAIYLAKAIHFRNDICVVKEMRESFTDPRDQQAALHMFQSEAYMLRRLNHPHIPRVLDHFEEHRKYFIVMDLVQGETLEAALNRQGAPGLPVDVVLDWADQICEVLEYLHNQAPPVIFRDLKPANIMVSPDNRIQLIDFGISRFFQPGKKRDTWNMGTSGYAPPEQYGPQGHTDVRSDVYALGATLHNLLSGRDPSQSPFQFQPLGLSNPALAQGIEAVIGKALAMNPADRYQSIREMREALSACQGAFDISVDFVHPLSYMQESPLCQFIVNFASKDTVSTGANALMVHVGLVLDVSNSMNDPEKFPPLLEAVRQLIGSLPDHYVLTIGLFSDAADLVLSLKPIGECKQNIGAVIRTIDQPRVKFGRSTCLAPALLQVVEKVRILQRTGIVHRLCVLTDGEIHDEDACAPVFDQIRSLGAEVYAYGFGSDWKKEPLWSLVQPCRAGTFKPVATDSSGRITSYDIKNTFDRFAHAGRNIIAGDAKLTLQLAQSAIAGDAFRYQPTARYLGSSAFDSNKVFQADIGSLERGISYAHCFEVKLQPTQETSHPIGTITLTYSDHGQKRVQRQPVLVERTADKRKAEQTVVQDVQEAFLILESLRTSDPQKLLRAYVARLDHLTQINGDPRQIKALQNTIQELRTNGNLDNLSEVDWTWLNTDSRGLTVTAIPH